MVDADERRIVEEQLAELHRKHSEGHDDEVVSFYPPEAAAEPQVFGVAGTNVDGTQWSIGDCGVRFPLHSVSKVFTYALALEDNGRTEVMRSVGVEPSGDPFNSITFDEAHNRPYNPMINAGALVTASLVHGTDTAEQVERIVEKYRLYTGNPHLAVDQGILAEQLESNDRNLGLCYLMRSLGMLNGDIDRVIEVYLSACSITVDARELSVMGATLARGGLNPMTGERAVPRRLVPDGARGRAVPGPLRDLRTAPVRRPGRVGVRADRPARPLRLTARRRPASR